MTSNPIKNACRLLREGAAELKNCHTLAATGHDWTGEPEAKAAYDEHTAAADALERVHAECEALRTGYAAARLEIESLRSASLQPSAGDEPVAAPQPAAARVVEVHPACKPDMLVNGGALKMALNVLRRAGKHEVADELEKTAAPAVAARPEATTPQGVLDLAREALEAALAGLEWYRDRCPDALNGSDDEADELIGRALEALITQTLQAAPQPPAVGQEPVAWYFKSPARPGEQPLIKKLDWRPHNRNWRPLVELAAVERATAPQPSPASQGDALDAVAAEREACAQECLRQAGLTVPSYDTAVACAAAIRARAAQEGK